MPQKFLYLGDTSLQSAAAYLAGVATAHGWTFDYVPSDQAWNTPGDLARYAAVVVSDYPASLLAIEGQLAIARAVREEGLGLWMIGGWESFQGSGGNWLGTPLAELLPVEISPSDDRCNCDRPAVPVPCSHHFIVDGLPWIQRPPLIGGFNRVTARPASEVLMRVETYALRYSRESGGEHSQMGLQHASSDPLLVVGTAGQGRVTAWMSDVAPHWVGPLVDWGEDRLCAQAPGADAIEVGDLYARFAMRMLNWTAQSDDP